MQAAAGGRRWRACPPRWRRWRLRCCCEVWQGWQAVGAVQVVQVVQGWRWCVVIVGGGLLLAWSSGAALAVLILPGAGGGRCDLLRLRCAGVVIVATAATPSACRAADPAGRAGGRREGKAKEKGQGGGAWCAAALAFCLHWRCDLLRRVHPGAYRGRRGSAPRFLCRSAAGAGTDPGATVPAAPDPAARPALAVLHPVRFCPAAGGVRFSTLPGSALGVGLELSEL